MANKKPVDPMYDEMLAAVKAAQGTSSGGGVQYLKPGDTTIKLVVPAGRTVRNFFQPYEDVDQKGLARTSFLIAAVITDADDNSVVDATRIRYIKVTATTLEHIITHLKNRWPLFDDEGPVFTITKLSSKPWYTGVAQRDEEFDASGIEHPEQTIEEAAEAESERSAEKAASAVPAPTSKAKRPKNDGEELPF